MDSKPVDIVSIPVQTSTPAAVPAGRPLAADILKGMQDAETPIDFIRNNLRAAPPSTVPQELAAAKDAERTAEEEARQKEAAKALEKPSQPSKETVEGYELNPDKKASPSGTEKAEEKPAEEKKAEEPSKADDKTPEEKELEALINDSTVVPAAENFKKLRTKLKETVKTVKELEAEKSKVAKELEEYKSGTVFPEILVEKENEIARLSHYEKLHSLKTSKEYQEKFVKPLEIVNSRLGALAADYEIPEDVIKQAVNIENKADLNRFLSQHFDDVGALEVKQLINEAKGITQAAKAAEAEPSKALDSLKEEHRRVIEFKTAERKAKIAEKSKDSWVDSLLKIKDEGKIIELIMKETDTDHNEKYVKPILTKAATEYGRLIRELAENGLEHLPDDLGLALARMVQLAHATAVAISTRNAALQQAEELQKNVQRVSSLVRPPIGSTGGGASDSIPVRTPASPTEAGQMLLDKVMGRKAA